MSEELRLVGECGPAKLFKRATVFQGKYPYDGSNFLVSSPGTPDQQTYSVCMGDSGAPNLPGHVWLKGWSENEGAPEALEAAGLVRLTGATWPTGYVEAQEAEILK